jgi:hypothetical protein
MTWLLDDAPGSEEIVEYEALLSHFYRNNRSTNRPRPLRIGRPPDAAWPPNWIVCW